MQSFKLSTCALFTILLTGCAATPPVVAAEPPTRAQSERLQDLETAAAQLRQQHLAMGETLMWLEGEIKAMRLAQPIVHQPVVDTPPAPVAAPAHAAVEAPAPVPEAHASTSPTPLVPEAAPAAEVSALSDEDLEAEPTEAEAATPAAPATEGFAVHIASYSRTDLLGRGWREMRTQYGDALQGLKPFGTTFTDTNGHHWARLNVGPFASRASATATCNQLKARDVFCDVQSVAADTVIAVR